MKFQNYKKLLHLRKFWVFFFFNLLNLIKYVLMEFLNVDSHDLIYFLLGGFPGGIVVKNPPANSGDTRDMGLIPGLGRSPGEGNGNPLFQCSCLENSMDRRPWWATFHGVAVRRD